MLGVRLKTFVTTQCLDVLHPVRDLASREIGALRQPVYNYENYIN